MKKFTAAADAARTSEREWQVARLVEYHAGTQDGEQGVAP